MESSAATCGSALPGTALALPLDWPAMIFAHWMISRRCD
jgi:hypothetical protein